MEANNDLATQPIPKLNEEQVLKHFKLLKQRSPHGFVELRALGYKIHSDWRFRKNAVGYFSDSESLIKAVRVNSGNRPLYLGMNTRNPELLHSLPLNTLVDNSEGAKDKNIDTRDAVFIDVDTKREAKNIASTDEELKAAIAVRDEIAVFLKEKGCTFTLGESGNGGHMYLFISPVKCVGKVDAKTDGHALFLRYLNRRFGTNKIEVDESTFNPSRIGKLYGTPSMKGSNTKKRPWRASTFEIPSEIKDIDFDEVFASEIEEQISFESSGKEKKSAQSQSSDAREVFKKFSGDLKTLDICALARAKGLEPKEIGEGQFSIKCPWHDEHTTGYEGDNSTSLFINSADSYPGFHCFHNSHGRKTIVDFLEWCGSESVDKFCAKKYKNKRKRKVYQDFEPFFDKELSNARKDIFSGDLMIFREKQWQPVVTILPNLISRAIDWNLPKSDVANHLERYAEQFHPELLVDIPEWDGVDRIKAISECLEIGNVSRATFVELVKDWGVKMLSRVSNPNIQNRMIVLKGGQGLGKDELVKAMLKSLGQFFAECPISSTNKDTTIAQSELLVIHISEFDKTLREGPGFLKAMITQEATYVRKPYARAAKLLKNRSSFVATVNVDDILRDHTGARRFLVFDIDKIDWSYPRGESLQILAQFNFLKKENYKASKESENEMAEYLASKIPVDPIENALELWDEMLFDLSCRGEFKKLRLVEIRESVSELARSLGIRFNKLLEIASKNNRSGRDSKGRFYFSLKKAEVFTCKDNKNVLSFVTDDETLANF